MLLKVGFPSVIAVYGLDGLYRNKSLKSERGWMGYFCLPDTQEVKAWPMENGTLSSGILFGNGF